MRQISVQFFSLARVEAETQMVVLGDAKLETSRFLSNWFVDRENARSVCILDWAGEGLPIRETGFLLNFMEIAQSNKVRFFGITRVNIIKFYLFNIVCVLKCVASLCTQIQFPSEKKIYFCDCCVMYRWFLILTLITSRIRQCQIRKLNFLWLCT